MRMHNPPHPGEVIADCMESLELSCRKLAAALCVSPSTLNRVIQCKASVSPEMAQRLSKALGSSPTTWLGLQNKYDLWNSHPDLSQIPELHKRHSENSKRH